MIREQVWITGFVDSIIAITAGVISTRIGLPAPLVIVTVFSVLAASLPGVRRFAAWASVGAELSWVPIFHGLLVIVQAAFLAWLIPADVLAWEISLALSLGISISGLAKSAYAAAGGDRGGWIRIVRYSLTILFVAIGVAWILQ